MRRRTSLLLLATAGVVLAVFRGIGVANPVTWAESRSGATLGSVGCRRATRPDARLHTDRVPAGGQRRSRPEAARRAGHGRGREARKCRQQSPAQPGLLLLPAGRDVHLDQPGDPEEHPRRGQRLPARHRLVRLLRINGQRQQLVRRDHPVPVDAGHARQPERVSAERRRPGHRLRPCRNRVLRADRVQPLQRHERGLRSALDERRLHVVARVRGHQRCIAHRRRRGLRRARRSAPAG